MQQRPEWWQQRQCNSWFWRHNQSYRLFKTSFRSCPALYKGTPCVSVGSFFFFLPRWLLHLPACKDAVKLILVSCLMAVMQVAPAHWGAELPQHWPLATALTAPNGSWQPTVLWNRLLHDYYGNTGHQQNISKIKYKPINTAIACWNIISSQGNTWQCKHNKT